MIVKPYGNHKFCHPMDGNKGIDALDVEAQREEKK
jgi:hypothetical protein